jgi:hypothetical protein
MIGLALAIQSGLWAGLSRLGAPIVGQRRDGSVPVTGAEWDHGPPARHHRFWFQTASWVLVGWTTQAVQPAPGSRHLMLVKRFGARKREKRQKSSVAQFGTQDDIMTELIVWHK